MQDVISGLIAELVSLILVAIGAGIMTVVGLLSNQSGFYELLNGGMALGMWHFLVGGIGLYVGVYLLGYQEIVPRIHTLFQRDDERTG
ncbi:cytochrome P450 [Halobacteria archaeon HArc-gm2]|nr:cytochrome P450 [Halobacteria archaeon HArc-gm2]